MTRRPWTIKKGVGIVSAKTGSFIAHEECFDSPADMEIAVLAVNSHEALVKALKAYDAIIEKWSVSGGPPPIENLLLNREKARTALASTELASTEQEQS